MFSWYDLVPGLCKSELVVVSVEDTCGMGPVWRHSYLCNRLRSTRIPCNHARLVTALQRLNDTEDADTEDTHWYGGRSLIRRMLIQYRGGANRCWYRGHWYKLLIQHGILLVVFCLFPLANQYFYSVFYKRLYWNIWRSRRYDMSCWYRGHSLGGKFDFYCIFYMSLY